MTSAKAQDKPCPLRAAPIVPALLAVVASIAAGLWFSYMGKALVATKNITYLMLMPVPPLFLSVPAIFLATLVATVSIAALALGASVLRRRAAPAPSYLPSAAAVNVLLFALTIWLAVQLAVSILWAGAIMVSAKSTADAAVTLRSVDPAIHRLIFQASGGAINGTETGFIVTVGEGKGPRRDVDIGKSSCSLFCFVFARAMMSDSMDCYCDVPIMAKIHNIALATLKADLVPGVLCSFIAFFAVLGLLVCGAAQFGGVHAARRAGCPAAAGACGRGAEAPGACPYSSYKTGA